jgi:hypothetical protein
MTQETYFLANRVWWAMAVFIGPIAGALAGAPTVAIAVTALLVLPTFLIFDTDRSWWPDVVRQLHRAPERTRDERRKLSLWSGVALLAGVLIAILEPSA